MLISGNGIRLKKDRIGAANPAKTCALWPFCGNYLAATKSDFMGRTYLFECSGAVIAPTSRAARPRANISPSKPSLALTARRSTTRWSDSKFRHGSREPAQDRAENRRGVEPAAAARCAPMAEIQAGLSDLALASHPHLETAGQMPAMRDFLELNAIPFRIWD